VYCEHSVKKMEEVAEWEGVERGQASQDEYSRLFNAVDLRNWREHFKRNAKTEEKIGESTYVKRVGLLSKKKLFKVESPCAARLQNHLVENYYIGNKKALFYNLKKYYDFQGKDVFQVIPVTFHVQKGVDDPQYHQFLASFHRFQELRRTDKDLRNVWIMKPGENTNRGNGISVCFGLDDVQFRLKSREKNKDGSLRTFILQKYIEKPLLYHGRKFDIRHYVLLTCFAGSVRAYWYDSGYVRTSSSPYSLRNGKDLFVHLTNDAIQKHAEGYGKYESGNKVSYEELEKYIAKLSRKERPASFLAEMLPQMRQIALEAVRATYHLLDRGRKEHNFELLGLDFMIDDNYSVQLIEVNTNPCLELSCPLLETIIPDLIENTLR
jgi:tubulin polyglutamylase TTLL1/tubulin monoglycylase TTLL3/8